MTAPRVDVELDKIEQNTRILVDRLAVRGVRVTAVTKAALGSPGVGAAMLAGGAVGLGDSRIPNLVRLAGLEGPASRTLIRSPMLSQAGSAVRRATTSLNTDRRVLEALDSAAARLGRVHGVVLMVELGDLREGIAVDEVPAAAAHVLTLPSLRLTGLGANLACQNGIVPDDTNMAVLSGLVDQVEAAHGLHLETISGGNSATLGWALSTGRLGRVDDLRLGEAILLGTEPLHRTPIPGLHLDAFTLVAEVIDVREKPAQPWGSQAQGAFGEVPARTGRGTVRQAIVALGRQDTEASTLVAPAGMSILGMSSDHLVLDVGDHPTAVGDEVPFGLGYAALLGAMTSPFVTKVEHTRLPARPALAVAT